MQRIKPMLRRGWADDSDYYRARALQEQIAAQKATCAAAQERHDELAMMYRFRAVMLSNGPVFEPDLLREKVPEVVR